MLDKEAEILRRARLLTPEHQAELLERVRVLYRKEHAAKQPPPVECGVAAAPEARERGVLMV